MCMFAVQFETIAISFLEKGVEMNDERAWKEKYIRDMRGW